MSGFYTPELPYDKLTYLNNLGAYTLSEGLDRMLDISREVEETEDYYWQGTVFPSESQCIVDPLVTFGDVIVVPALSLLTAITGCAIFAPNNTGPGTVGNDATLGFKLRIYDKGGKIDTVVNSSFIRKQMVAESLFANANNGTPPTFGPFLLPAPMFVLAPGALQVEVTNLDPANQILVQVFFNFAIPINGQSTNQVIVGSSRKS